MDLRQARHKIIDEINARYGRDEAQAIADILLEHLTGLNRSGMILKMGQELSKDTLSRLAEALERLKKGEPIQYITGQCWFYGLSFTVSPAVLIPRPETEELVNWVLRDHPIGSKIKALDIGTGSGCIPISLKKERPDWEIAGLDISADALAIARENSESLQVDIAWVQADIREMLSDEDLNSVDIIISNPPYIPQSDRDTLAEHVREFEPALALFVPDENPLLFYEVIAGFARKKLRTGGSVYLEINESRGEEAVRMLQSRGFGDIQLRTDLQGKARMIKAGF